MTSYQQIQKERSYASLEKVIAAAQKPVSYMDIAEATGMHPAHIRGLVMNNIEHFKSFGQLSPNGGRKVSYFQALNSKELVVEQFKQPVYLSPYDQLMGNANYIDMQSGRKVTSE